MEIIEAAADMKKRRISEDEEEEDDDSIPAAQILSEEEGKKKATHIFLRDFDKTGFRLRWITINPHEESPSFIEKTELLKAEHPDHFDTLLAYQVVALQSKLYFLGGFHDPGTYSNKVFAFDTGSGKWERLADMRHGRGDFTAVSCGGRIYVFGYHFAALHGTNEPFHHLSPSQWAEFYDPTRNEWDYIPGGTPLEVTQAIPGPRLYSLIEEQKVVLFWVNPELAQGYSLCDNRWFSTTPSNPFFSSYFRNRFEGLTLAAVKSNIVWFSDEGGMFTYNLEPDGLDTSPADAIPPSLEYAATHPRHTTSTPSLPPHVRHCLWGDCVNAGNGKLCFIACGPHYIFVLRLDLRYSPSRKAFIPHYQGYNMHAISSAVLYSSLAM